MFLDPKFSSLFLQGNIGSTFLIWSHRSSGISCPLSFKKWDNVALFLLSCSQLSLPAHT